MYLVWKYGSDFGFDGFIIDVSDGGFYKLFIMAW